MKTKFIYITAAVLIVIGYTGKAQNTLKDSAIIKEILSRIEKVEKEKFQKIGTIAYDTNKLYAVYKGNKFEIRRVKVDSATLNIVDGNVIDVSVYAEGNRFTNKQAPIALTLSRMNKQDHLGQVGGNISLVFQEIFSLVLDNNYIPDDAIIKLHRGKTSELLQRGAGINTILDARIYSDGLGLVGGQPNGLAQTDLKFKQILHRKNISNHGVAFLRYLKINMHTSKFDSKDKYVDSSSYSRSRLLQKSYVRAEMALNIFDCWLFEKKSSHAFYIDGGGGVDLCRLSKKHDSVTTEIAIPYWFAEAGVNLKVSDNIGANAQIRYTNQYLPSNDFTNDKGLVEFYKFGAEIYYNPIDDRPSRIFARVNYNLSMIKADQKNGFFQFQIGYSVLLTKLINKK